ncbi:MAG: radical SAM protein [Candidatus Bathyarchaeota archaeon]|nr:radical SAM protein [Candidatus Bathyarchaeota archaeon]
MNSSLRLPTSSQGITKEAEHHYEPSSLFIRTYGKEKNVYLTNSRTGECFIVDKNTHGAIKEKGLDIFARHYSGHRIKGLLFHITGKCNLKCIHCYASNYRGRNFSFEQVNAILKKAQQLNIERVSITGGEPFVRKDLLSIINRICDYNFHLYPIFSNGTLLDKNPKVIDYICEHFDTAFYISLHGLEKEHDLFVGVEGAFKRTIIGINLLKDCGIKIVINTNLTNVNCNVIINFYRFLKELGISKWRISRPFNMGAWENQEKKFGVSLEEEFDCLTKLLRLYREDGEPFDLDLGYIYKNEKGHKLKDSYSLDDFVCAYYRQFLVIYQNGNVTFCPKLNSGSIVAGNIIKEELKDIVERKLLWQQKDLRIKDMNGTCLSCKHLNKCGAGCRANAYQSTGDINGVDLEACDKFKLIASDGYLRELSRDGY